MKLLNLFVFGSFAALASAAAFEQRSTDLDRFLSKRDIDGNPIFKRCVQGAKSGPDSCDGDDKCICFYSGGKCKCG